MRTGEYSNSENRSYKSRVLPLLRVKSFPSDLALISKTEKKGGKKLFPLEKNRISFSLNYLKDNPTSFIKDKKFAVNPYI